MSPCSPIVHETHFLSIQSKHFNVSLKRKEYVWWPCWEDRMLLCGTWAQSSKVNVTEAMRVKGYSDLEAADSTVHMQVRQAIKKIKGEVYLCPNAVAATLLLPLLTAANVARPALRTITQNQGAAPIIVVVGVNVVYSHLQKGRCGKCCTKSKLVNKTRWSTRPYMPRHSHAWPLSSPKREQSQRNAQCTTAQAIQQVKGGFRACGYGINLRKLTISLLVALGIVSKFPGDEMDKRDPQFDVFQDIQSQNNYSTA